MEKHRDAQEDLHLAFIDLEKVRIPRDLIWQAVRAQEVPEIYVRTIQDLYDGATTRVRCTARTSEEFEEKFGVHHASVLISLLFILVLFFLTKNMLVDAVWALLFADDVVLGSKCWQALQIAFDKWKEKLEGAGLKISEQKTEHMDCKFANPTRSTQHLYFNTQQIPECIKFKYLGSIVNNSATCDEDVQHRINVGWTKWRENSAIFCDRRMPLKLKGKMHSATVQTSMLNGSQCWSMYKEFERKITAADMKTCRISCGVTKLDHIRSSRIRGSLHIKKSVVEKLHDDRNG